MSLAKDHISYKTVETAETPLGEIMLRRYDTERGEGGYEIRLNGNFLMATHGASSEKAMASLAFEALKQGDPARKNLAVLVGGLGAGYTLGAALTLPEVASATVVEISEKVVEWNRKYFAATNGRVLDDPRVKVRVGDLADHLAECEGAYDLALLDVDNGPGWLAAEGNDRLYSVRGIESIRDALRPGGVAAVWSPSENSTFYERFQTVFSDSRVIDTTLIGRAVEEPGDVIYLGRKAER